MTSGCPDPNWIKKMIEKMKAEKEAQQLDEPCASGGADESDAAAESDGLREENREE